MAGLKEAIQDLLTKCAAIDGILHTAIWNNQLNYEEEGKLYDYPKPAIFIEANAEVWQPVGRGYSQSDMTISIHLLHEQYDATDGTFEQNLDVFDLIAGIIKVLSGYKPSQCSNLMKIGEKQDSAHTQTYHYIVTFACSIIDTAGSVDAQGIEQLKAPPTTLIQNVIIQHGT